MIFLVHFYKNEEKANKYRMNKFRRDNTVFCCRINAYRFSYTNVEHFSGKKERIFNETSGYERTNGLKERIFAMKEQLVYFSL